MTNETPVCAMNSEQYELCERLKYCYPATIEVDEGLVVQPIVLELKD